MYGLYVGIGHLVEEKLKATGQLVEEKLMATGQLVEEKLTVRDAKLDSMEKSMSGLKTDLDKSVEEKLKATGQLVEEKLMATGQVRDAKLDSMEKSMSGLKTDLDKSLGEIKSLFLPVLPKVTLGEKAFEMAQATQGQIVNLASQDLYNQAKSKNSSSSS
jgi:hypothetical protein